jgi:hypothetical protein
MIKEAYEAGVKQALVDALAGQGSSPVGSPAIKPTPPVPPPVATPPSPTMVAGNKISPAATMQPKPTEVGETQMYNEGVKAAMAAAGLTPMKPAAPATPTAPMTPAAHATRPAGITQPSGADKGMGGTGLGKGLLNTGGGETLGKLGGAAHTLLAPALAGAEVGGVVGSVSPKTVGHDPLWEHPALRILKGSGKGALYGGGAGLGLGAAALGGMKLVDALKRIPK